MARLLTAEECDGRAPNAMYGFYRRYPFFTRRASLIAQRYPAASRLLVVGCGPGYLVDELIKAGKAQTWGVDASPFAVGRAATALGATVGARVRQADATDAAALLAAKQAMGLGRNQRFDLAITEDVLPCLTTQEQTALLAAVRGQANALFHVVTPGDPADPAKLPGLDWRSTAAWKALVGTDPVLDAETWGIS